MSNRTAWALILAGTAAAAYWYLRRAAASSSSSSAGLSPVNVTAQTVPLPGAAAIGAGIGLSNIDFSTITGGVSDAMNYIASGFEPRGIRNNNPGNLRYIADPARAWNGQAGNDNGYGIYSSPAYGVRALGHQLMNYAAAGETSIAALISTWAPASDGNNTGAYIADVAAQMGVDPAAPIDVYANLPALANAIIQHENGQNPYAPADVQGWVYS